MIVIKTEYSRAGFGDRIQSAARKFFPSSIYNAAARAYRFALGEKPLFYPKKFPAEQNVRIGGVRAKFIVNEPLEVDRVFGLSGEGRWVKREILPYLYPGVVVFDIGANMGSHAVIFAKSQPGAKIYAIEPDPRFVEEIGRNVLINGCSGRVQILPVALSDLDGSLGMVLDPDRNITRAADVHDHEAENTSSSSSRFTVACSRIETLVASKKAPSPDILKIDVEGSELNVLKGMGEVRPGRIYVEVHQNFGVSFRDVGSLLSQMGYKLSSKPVRRGDQLLCHFSKP